MSDLNVITGQFWIGRVWFEPKCFQGYDRSKLRDFHTVHFKVSTIKSLLLSGYWGDTLFNHWVYENVIDTAFYSQAIFCQNN